MPRLDARAVQALMRRRGFLFKHQFVNQAGLSYDRLTEILVDDVCDVEDDIVARLCAGLDCEPTDILISDTPA